MTTAVRSWFLRLLVSGAVLAVLLRLLPVGDLLAAMRAVPAGRWAIVLASFLVGHAITAYKWRLLMGPRADVPWQVWLRAHFSGLVANLALPSVAGGDVVRAAIVMRRATHRDIVAVASVADRLIDTAGLLALAAIAAVVTGGSNAGAGRTLALAAGLAVLGIACGWAGLAWLRRRKPGGFVGRVVDAVDRVLESPERLVAAFVLSTLVQSVFIVLSAWLGEAAGVHVGLGAWFLAWPLAKLTAMLPVSLAGIGVREAALVVFLRPFGAPPAGVMASGLLWQAVLLVSGFFGWIVLHTLPDGSAAAATSDASTS